MDSSFWFYTLSAIPQTLAAVIALATTFVVFKLNHIEIRTQKEHEEIKLWLLPLRQKEIDEISKLDDGEVLSELNNGIQQLDSHRDRLGFAKYDALYDLYKRVIFSYERKFEPTPERIYLYLLERARILHSLLEGRRIALRYLKSCLLWTVGPIVGSIFLLPLYEWFTSYSIPIVLIAGAFAVFAVFYTAYCVWKIAHPQLR